MDMALLSSSLRFARSWGECGLNLAFPWPESREPEPVSIEAPFCQQCGEPFPSLEEFNSSFLCTHCTERQWHFEWARAGYRTDGQIREAVVGFKYGEQYYQRVRLIEWLTEAFDRHVRGGDWHALVPVPLYHRRFRDRGFNQAEEIALGLGKKRKLPIWNCLYRYRETVSQTTLERSERWENMSGAFRMKPRFDVTGGNLLLIDDVLTTGATVNACAHTLAQAGAARLAVLTIARS
jgi:ComF family protein